MTFGMDFTARNIAINCIEVYQRYISPYKGCCCAHRAVHDGASCSEWAKRAIRRVGIYGAFPLIVRRLKACNTAYLSLKQPGYSAKEGNDKEEENYNPFTDKQNLACCLSGLPCIPFLS